MIFNNGTPIRSETLRAALRKERYNISVIFEKRLFLYFVNN